MPSEVTAPPPICARCGTPAAGTPADGWFFCVKCGAPLAGARCSGCDAPLTPGAKHCHRCGLAVGSGAAAARAKGPELIPWAIAAVALVTLFAALAGRGFNRRAGSTLDAPQNALPQAGLDFAVPASGEQSVRAPDISSLSPQERADRLFNRVMQLSTEGKTDSVQFFAPMAISAYMMLGPLDADQRYDVGRIAEAAGAIPLARAQADSILLAQPSHLLGLLLAARVASITGDVAARGRYEARLLAAEAAELARRLPEYERHEPDIMTALAQARRNRR